MKLLTKACDKSDAIDMKMKLEAKGIPIYIGGDSSGPAVGMIYGSDSYTVWVENDSQLECAAYALKDETYMPINTIDVAEYRSQQQDHVNVMKQAVGKFFDRVLNVVMVAVLVTAVYFFYSKAIT